MLRSKDLNAEIKELELVIENTADEKKLLKTLIKALALLLKITRDIRTNQVTRMKHDKIELVKDNRNTTPGKKDAEKKE